MTATDPQHTLFGYRHTVRCFNSWHHYCLQAIPCQYTMFWQTAWRFYLRYFSQPWGSNSKLYVKQTCILSGRIARREITGCNNHHKCCQLLCSPAKNEVCNIEVLIQWFLRNAYRLYHNYIYTVTPRYSFTVCSPQFVAVNREWRHINGGAIFGYHCISIFVGMVYWVALRSAQQ